MSKNDISPEEKSKLCLECGAYCCKIVTFLLPADESFRRLYQARGIDIKFFITDHIIWYAVIPQICQHLENDRCKIYKNRPLNCVLFDGRNFPETRDKCLWPKED
jgi:Fe-S-cluster containining protein